jgi:hypothetical protein
LKCEQRPTVSEVRDTFLNTLSTIALLIAVVSLVHGANRQSGLYERVTEMEARVAEARVLANRCVEIMEELK